MKGPQAGSPTRSGSRFRRSWTPRRPAAGKKNSEQAADSRAGSFLPLLLGHTRPVSGGEYPGSAKPDAAREKIGRLLDAGVRQVINLMEPHETNFGGNVFALYEDFLQELARQRNVTARVRRFSIPDMRTPGPGKMRQILDTIDASLARQVPVYVHCLGGLGRTGTVVGCFLIHRGMAGADDVLEQIAGLRENEPLSHLPSPEAGIQREFIRRWEGF